MRTDISVFWFRRDLRIHDNTGLYQALRHSYPVMPLFIFDTEILTKLENKYDRRVLFIYRTLELLKAEFKSHGADLLIEHGSPEEVWKRLTETYSVKHVFTNCDYEPYAIRRDQNIAQFLSGKNIPFSDFKDQCIFEKNEVVKDDGKPYTVFTPYSKRWKSKLATGNGFFEKSYPTEKYLTNLYKPKFNYPIPTLEQLGFTDVEIQIPNNQADEKTIRRYTETRDFPGINGTSKLSVHLRFGTISIRELVRNTKNLNETFLNELIWREFYMMILWHFPHVVSKSFKPEYDLIKWRNNEIEFSKWCEGKTGYPIVDAGMRELLQTGYMHNRVRMITASFLTKHLLIDWRWGEAWFAAHLLDYDLSANNGGWQWAAGSGTDAAPYFRVFNPYIQTEKFDAEGRYIRKWVPELLTPDYPKPIISHEQARIRCLETYKTALEKEKSGK